MGVNNRTRFGDEKTQNVNVTLVDVMKSAEKRISKVIEGDIVALIGMHSCQYHDQSRLKHKAPSLAYLLALASHSQQHTHLCVQIPLVATCEAP
jgi:hypothetical protein